MMVLEHFTMAVLLLHIILLPLSGNSEVIFGAMETVFWLQNGSRIYSIQEDLFIPGNLLASLDSWLVTIDSQGHISKLLGDGKSGYAEGVGSSAKFSYIEGMLQLSTGEVILADVRNHCLRLANRKALLTKMYAGKCKVKGFEDGNFTLARFTYPRYIAGIPDRTSVFLFDKDRTIRKVDLLSESVTTLYENRNKKRTMFSLVWFQNELLITVNHGICKLKNNSLTLLTGEYFGGSFDGPLNMSRFTNPTALLKISHKTLLVADDTNRLRVIDLSTNTVTSVCSGYQGMINAAATRCSLFHPSALALVNRSLYVVESGGYRGGLRKISFQLSQDQQGNSSFVKISTMKKNITVETTARSGADTHLPNYGNLMVCILSGMLSQLHIPP